MRINQSFSPPSRWPSRSWPLAAQQLHSEKPCRRSLQKLNQVLENTEHTHTHSSAWLSARRADGDRYLSVMQQTKLWLDPAQCEIILNAKFDKTNSCWQAVVVFQLCTSDSSVNQQTHVCCQSRLKEKDKSHCLLGFRKNRLNYWVK